MTRRRDTPWAGGRAVLVFALLALGASVVALGGGALAIAPPRVAAILLDAAGLDLTAIDPTESAVVLSLRLPRVLLGALVGATLAAAGAAMQGLFRNPLVEPALIGVSAGAALAAAGVLVLGLPVATALEAGPFALLAGAALPVAAFLGGLAVTVVACRLAAAGGRTRVATLLLTGVALNALCFAGNGLLLQLADDRQLRDLTFWNLGSLSGVTRPALLASVPFLAAALLGLPRFARALNALSLGECEARHLGVEVERVKRRLITLVALGTGAAVAVCGVIGFVGLVAPHVVRLLLGPDHRSLLPCAALLGAALLPLADLAARTLAAPRELPLGVVTALVGAPFFLFLVVRERRVSGAVEAPS